MLSAIPNASILISPLTMQEAVLSSKIEGTQATMGEVLQFEAGVGKETIDPENISMRMRPIGSSNWRSFMPSSNRCTRFWTATDEWAA